MSHFLHHVFFCTNQRSNGAACCEDHHASALRAYAKQRILALAGTLPGNVRINTAGGLDRCELGPVLVVYPQGVWYRYRTEKDIDEIIEQHLISGQPVTRLQV